MKNMQHKIVYLALYMTAVLGGKERKKLDLDPVDGRKTYEEYAVIEGEVKTTSDLEWLNKIRRYDQDLDFWWVPRKVGDKVHIMRHNSHNESLEKLFTEIGFTERNIFIENVDEVVGLTFRRFLKRKKDKSSPLRFISDDFHPYLMIDDEIDAIVERKCPEGLYCEAYTIGQTSEGRNMRVLKIHKNLPDRKAHFVVSGIHGRDWYSVSANMMFVSSLLVWYGYPEDYPNVQTLMDDGDWYFLFVANPDGYSYTWTDDRLWRKNKGDNRGHAQCAGVDINANFDYNWHDSDHSKNFCMNNYKGFEPASEPETQAIQKELDGLGSSLRMILNIKDYDARIMMPWGKGESLENMEPETQKLYELCKIGSGSAFHIRLDKGFSEESCFPPEYTTGGDITGYARFKVGVPNVLEISFPSEERGYGAYNPSLHSANYELISFIVSSVYTLRNETFPTHLVHNFDPAGKDEL